MMDGRSLADGGRGLCEGRKRAVNTALNVLCAGSGVWHCYVIDIMIRINR